jgi:ABC-type transport system substrate-binding protein
MRKSLVALCLVSAAAFVQTPLSAQIVEESLAQDPGPLDFIQGDSYEQWILQSLARDTLVGIAADGRLVPRLADHWKARKDGTVLFFLRSDARYLDGH